ncbi:MAG: winged helix-turn-helix transcriptional regulator [Burkholderiales bacterium]|nr:winged helix-turn-helix transcriptional regulator [Burkholderiales bacterium]
MPTRRLLPQAAAAPTGDVQALAAARVLRRFRLVFNSVKTHFQQVEKQAGIGGAQLWALSVVSATPGIGVKALAQAMDIHQATASNLVRGLVAGGLIVAQRSAPDRRAVQLNLLPAGAKVMRKAPGPFAGVLPEALAGLDAATLERLDNDLAVLITALAADERAAGIPLAQM